MVSTPERFPVLETPDDNPLTVEGVELGRHLFYDPILSGDGTQSCASCHQQAFSFTDPDQFSTGILGLQGTRNAMPIINVGWMSHLFWDGRAGSVEEQALEPVVNPVEMHGVWDDAVAKLQSDAAYTSRFNDAFGTETVSADLVVKAIAQFERTLVSANSRYDQFLRGELQLNEQELAGRVLFFTETGDCFHCHGGALFTDQLFHNNGLDSTPTDAGREAVTSNPHDRGKFKTPTLRNVALTAPYMHDGRFNTLEEVVAFYSEGLQSSPTVDPLMKNVAQGGIQLSPTQQADLVAFLRTLTDAEFVNNTKFADPR